MIYAFVGVYGYDRHILKFLFIFSNGIFLISFGCSMVINTDKGCCVFEVHLYCASYYVLNT